MSEAIGFIGMGHMGTPMAKNLLAAGYTLHVYNRTPEKTASLVKLGATAASSPAELAKVCSTVISMVADDAALEQLVLGPHGLLQGLASGALHISMSTILPDTARRLAERHAEHGSAYVAAPVFGRPEAAAAKKLWICLSGEQAARQRAEPVLRALGQSLFDFGPEAGAANVVKLSGNFLIASALEALGEALALGEKNGVDRTALASMLSQTLFACPVYQNYSKAIAEHAYQPAGFRLALGFKDIGLIEHTAARSRTPMPLAGLLRNRFLSALAKGREDYDWAALALGSAEDAGLA